MVSFVSSEVSTFQTYQLLFPCISWDKHHHTLVFFMVVLCSKALHLVENKVQFSNKSTIINISRVLRWILDKVLDHWFSLPLGEIYNYFVLCIVHVVSFSSGEAKTRSTSRSRSMSFSLNPGTGVCVLKTMRTYVCTYIRMYSRIHRKAANENINR